jgi:hypothetical protein
MRRHAEAKRQAGFGQFMELPACVYAVGTLLGVLDYYHDVIYYVLPKGIPDLGCNYVRCKRWRPSEGLYIPGPLHPWNDGERNGTFIPSGQVARVTHFSRGMFNQGRYEALINNQEGSPHHTEQARFFVAYCGRLERLVHRSRYWNLDLQRFLDLVAERDPNRSFETSVTSGAFDLLISELARIKTDDGEPLDLVRGE